MSVIPIPSATPMTTPSQSISILFVLTVVVAEETSVSNRPSKNTPNKEA